MLFLAILLTFLAVLSGGMIFMPFNVQEERPSLETLGFGPPSEAVKKQGFMKQMAMLNKPLTMGELGQRLNRDLSMSYTKMTPEEFILMKEVWAVTLLFIFLIILPKDMLLLGVLVAIGLGYLIPEYWLKKRIQKVKNRIIKELPDVVDLLALCVNAGLDFMLSLKWVVEKSPPSVMVDQLNTVLQEINVGKTRRDALRDLARRYNLPDLSTFSRTLIMADKMGTSMTDALNALSIDMRYARFRRGEAMALKAPLKMLIPLIFCIFPVVGILVMGPILLNFLKMDPTSMIKM